MGNSSSPYSTLILIALMVLAFYILIIRPNKKRQQAQLQTMNSLTAGTRVLLTSGVFGTLVEVGQKQAVIELSPGVHLTVLKQAIARAVREGDEDTDDDDDTPFEGSFDERSVDEVRTVDGVADERVDGDLRPNQSHGPSGSHHDITGAGGSTAVPGAAGAQGLGPDSRPSGDDTDPRSGTNTTPIKD
jgi:preprotein translocase subunit YajC